MTRYDEIGQTYTLTRRADPRLRAAIERAVGAGASVVNVGAGTGSYEPDGTLWAIEPSAAMIAQRPPGSAPALQAGAEAIPLPDGVADVALAVLTVHHWTDVAAGLAELRRIAPRQVVLTWDQTVTREFWLSREYLPRLAEIDDARARLLSEIATGLGGAEVIPLPIPHDCVDGFMCAYWRRPERYLDPLVRAGISTFSLLREDELQPGLTALAADLASGEWQRRHADLLALETLDLGYRLVVAGGRVSTPT